MNRTDPELGPVRLCRRCDEWWPDDDEFWYREPRRPRVRHCRACKSERGQHPRRPRP